MVPDKIDIDGTNYGATKFRTNNELLEQTGLEKVITASSTQAAGRIPIGNVPKFLLGAEYQMIKMGRDAQLASYNDYREAFGLNRISSFKNLTSDTSLQSELNRLYNSMDNLEFTVGIFAETPDKESLFGELLNKMVAYDAFTGIYTNPLLAKKVFTAEHFTQEGMDIINQTNSLQDLVDRNTQGATASFDFA